MNRIEYFNGDNFFLSNFAPCVINYEGVTFPSSENAFQAAKTSKENWGQFLTITAGQSKRLGKTVTLRSDWDQVRLKVMEDILRIKFDIPAFREKLLATGDAELIEGNTWNDCFWGECPLGNGQNYLGKILMKIRSELLMQNKLA